MRMTARTEKLFVFLCMFAVIFCCCSTQTEKSVLDMSCIPSSGYSMLQAPRARAELPAMLDEEQWTADDDAAASERLDGQKTGAARKAFVRLLLSHNLLAGVSALFAYLSAGIFHGSSCPTYGLSYILKFIQSTDGQKETISFSYID